MKKTLPIFFLLFVTSQLHADPQYILIKLRWFRGAKITHVDMPKKNLKKWSYDAKNDTYYRMKTHWGIGVKIYIEEIKDHPEYILINQGWVYGWEMMSVDKPQKKLNKWYYDSKNGTHYGMKRGWHYSRIR